MTRPALANGWRRISPRTGGRKMDLTSTNSFAAKFHPTNLAGGQKACSILHGFARWHRTDARGEIFVAKRFALLQEQTLRRVW